MTLSKEEIISLGKATANEVLKQIQLAQFTYREPRNVVDGLIQSSNEELTASYWYRERANHAMDSDDETTAKLYEHIAGEEDSHYWEFQKRLEQMRSGS